MREHTWHECNKEDCYTCRGSLASCTVCWGAEGTLPSECPGEHMSADQQEAIMADKIDYFRGRWWQILEPEPTLMGDGKTHAVNRCMCNSCRNYRDANNPNGDAACK